MGFNMIAELLLNAVFIPLFFFILWRLSIFCEAGISGELKF